MAKRAGMFEEDLDIDFLALRPRTGAPAPPAEDVRAVAEKANFRSREAGQKAEKSRQALPDWEKHPPGNKN